MKQLNEHDHDEECCCHECKEKQLSEKEIERIIEENYSEKDEKTKKFIRKSLKIHGLEYNYDKTVFIRSTDKVIITCQIHGDFSIIPGDHIRTNRDAGCPDCGKLRIIMKRRDTADDFIRKSEKLYPGRLDYSNVIYINSRTEVILICKKHGTEFNIKPSSHLSGNFGCPDCAKEINSRTAISRKGKKKSDIWTFEKFKSACIAKFGNKFNYDKAEKEYVNFKTPVTIVCPEHGEFKVTPYNHHRSITGCPKCGHDLMIKNKTFTREKFIELAELKFPGKFDYSKVIYTRAKDKVIIRCIKHDKEFEITPDVFLGSKHGCPDCAKGAAGLFSKYTISELQEAINSIYGDGVYVIPEQKYEGIYVDIRVHDIKWNEDFVTKPVYLLSGTGNPNHRNKSTGEQIIIDWCKENSIIFNYQTKITGEGITGRNSSGYVIVDFKLTYNNLPIIIEYNGEQHYKNIPFFHKTLDSFEKQIKRDEELRNYCKNNEIKLIEIPYIVEDVSSFLTKTVIENIDPLTLVDYDSLYVVNDNST